MSQTALITLLSILLFTGGLFGGGQKPSPPRDSAPPAAVETGDERPGVVRVSTVAVHDSPDSREVVAHLVRGDRVTIIGQQQDWYRVRLANGQVGFVSTFGIATASPSTPGQSVPNYEVIAYYLTDTIRPSWPSLEQNLRLITTVIPWMWQVTPTGNLIADFHASEVGRALALAGTNGGRGLALVHNVRQTESGAVTFDASLAHQILSNPDARRVAIENLYRQVRSWGMNGIHIDFESVLPRDRQNLNTFVRELGERFRPEGLEVTIAVPAKTRESLSDSWAGGYDYATLGRYADKIMLMTYDEHWRGGEPGPVASVGWVERVVRYALSTGVPPEKIVLGVPAYGYDWPANGRGRSVTYQQAMETASRHGARIRWDDVAKVPYFSYGAGRKVYFENRSSISHKLEIVKQYGLGGISLWRLGQEDPGIWTVIAQQLS